MRNLKVSVRVILAFGLILTVLAGVGGVIYANLRLLEQAKAITDHTFNVIRRANLLDTAMAEQESSVRGYGISGNRSFLETGTEGRRAAAAHLAELKRLVADPAAQRLLVVLQEQIEDWQSAFADRVINGLADPARKEEALQLLVRGEGKQRMDRVRSTLDEILVIQRRLLEERSAEQQEAFRETYLYSAAGATLLIVIVLLSVLMIQRSVVRPLVAMTATMRRLADGDLEAAIEGAEHNDEIGEMARTVQVFKNNAVEKQRLQAEQKQREEAERAGDMAQRERERRAAEEIAGLVSAVARGDVSQRLQTAGKDGLFLAMAEGINQLAVAIDSVMTEIGGVLNAMAGGDLSKRIRGDYAGVFGRIKDDTNAMAAKLTEIVTRLSESATQVKAASAEISAGSQDLSSRTESQASSLEETAAAMQEITATVKGNADNAQAANQLAATARGTAEKGGSVVAEAVTAMGRIEESAQKISDIVSLIDEIAFQTNLLALNASVEAARAGEAGKGFAVVAQEVRALAQRSANASKDIKALINESNVQVKTGAGLVNQAGTSLIEIVAAIKKVSDIVGEIAAASREQATGLDQVNTAVGSMDEMTQRNSALVEETTASARSLADQAAKLADVLGFFQNTGAASASVPASASLTAATIPAGPAAKPATAKPIAAKPQPGAKPDAAPTPAPKRLALAGAGLAPSAADDDEWQEF